MTGNQSLLASLEIRVGKLYFDVPSHNEAIRGYRERKPDSTLPAPWGADYWKL